MTKLKIGFLFILFIVSIGFLLNKGISDEFVKPSELANLINSKDQVFTVASFTGDVYFGDGVKFTKLTVEETIFPNKTYIKTDNGTAQILLSDNSIINLDSFTNIQIDFETDKLNVKQLYGRTWHRIKDIVSYGEYRVVTDNTITSVRGTIFSVTIDYNGNTDIHVIESEVEVIKGEKRADGTWEILDKGLFKAGERARVWKKRDILIERGTNDREFLNSPWYRNNTNSRDLLKRLEPGITNNVVGSENGDATNTSPDTENNGNLPTNPNYDNSVNDIVDDVLGGSDADPVGTVNEIVDDITEIPNPERGVNDAVEEVLEDPVGDVNDAVDDLLDEPVPPFLNIKIPLKIL